MIDEELSQNYMKALEQKFNAVCFDIDGTLTEKDSIKIDLRILPKLASILKNHIPIVFITGRGETGLKNLVQDIVEILKNKYNVTQKELQKIYALVNDGARIFITSNGSQELFNVNKYISSEESLINLEKMDEIIKKKLKSQNF